MLGATVVRRGVRRLRSVRGRIVIRVAAVVGIAVLVGALGLIGKAWWDSRIPETYSVMSYGTHDFGGGSEPAAHDGHASGAELSVDDLHGVGVVSPDARFALTARSAAIRLASGRTIAALTFNGRSPGPELRVRQGDDVEVVLENEDVEQGVTIHWHGVDVPNAEDGVAGVTQNAVLPGERYTYRFRAEQVGTFWYHTHQVSSKEVRRGLFGVFVIEPRERPTGVDLALAVHTYDVLAIDGTELNEPTELVNVSLPIAAGGRFDVGFVQPPRSVRLGIEGSEVAIGLSPQRAPAPAEQLPVGEFDPLAYGSPAPTPFDATSAFDRRFVLKVSRKPGFFDGRPGRQWAINGGIYPDVPVFVVEEGDLVEMTIVNDTNVVHPMHLHGHHVLVLSRDAVPATGSPWWSDTLNVSPGESYVVAFRADNPGIWMDHCHNLPHAAKGLTMHVAYAGVSTPFLVGAEHDNEPE